MVTYPGFGIVGTITSVSITDTLASDGNVFDGIEVLDKRKGYKDVSLSSDKHKLTLI